MTRSFRNPKPPGKCIFCRGGGLSKEHLFAEWLRALFPRTPRDTHTLGTVVSWTPRPQFARTIRQGHSGSRKVRKVCRRCNSGWISFIDNAAKVVAPALIQGQPSIVTREAQQALAVWFAKIATVADSINPDRSVVLQSDRDWLRTQSKPPLLWEVWIGSYHGINWRDLGIFQHSGRLDLTSVTGPHKLAGYLETTCLGLGNMIALVVGMENPHIEVNIGKATDILTRIWPMRDSFDWPLAHVLSDDEAGAVAVILGAAVANPRPPQLEVN